MWRLKLYRGTWCAVRRHNEKTQRISLRTKDRASAERALKDFQNRPAGDLIGDIVPAYIADKTEQGARSIAAMEFAWKALESTFGHLRPDQVTRPLCRSYAHSRRSGVAGRKVKDGTIIKELGVLKAALKWAKADRDATFEMPSAPPPRDRYITREEMEKLAQSAESAHTELFIRLAWATAGRAEALLTLTWAQIDFERGQIRLDKGEGRRKGRATVPMTDSLRTALKAAFSVRTTDYVIEWGGEPIRNISKAFRRACERAGLKGVSPHILRHSAARTMAEDGVPMAAISQYLGHGNSLITERVYAKFSPSYLKKAAASLE